MGKQILVEVDGIRQMMDEALLDYSQGYIDNENEYTTWQEWKLDGKIVKRGAHVRIKKSPLIEGLVHMFGG